MILVTVGTQLPFPRLIRAMADLAPDLGEPVIAQCGGQGGADTGGADPAAVDLRPHLEPAEFDALFAEARVVVAHAGIGTILSARRLARPLIILPRRHALGEHRNDHQLATARQVQALSGIHVAWQTGDLGPLLRQPSLAAASDGRSPSHEALIARLRGFIGQTPAG